MLLYLLSFETGPKIELESPFLVHNIQGPGGTIQVARREKYHSYQVVDTEWYNNDLPRRQDMPNSAMIFLGG